MIMGFNLSTLAEEIEKLRLSLYENLSPAEIERLYSQGLTDDYHAPDH